MQNKKLQNNEYYYNRNELDKMLENNIITDLSKMFDIFNKETLVIFADNVKEIKVVLNEYGTYTNAVITKDDLKIYVEL